MTLHAVILQVGDSVLLVGSYVGVTARNIDIIMIIGNMLSSKARPNPKPMAAALSTSSLRSQMTAVTASLQLVYIRTWEQVQAGCICICTSRMPAALPASLLTGSVRYLEIVSCCLTHAEYVAPCQQSHTCTIH